MVDFNGISDHSSKFLNIKCDGNKEKFLSKYRNVAEIYQCNVDEGFIIFCETIKYYSTLSSLFLSLQLKLIKMQKILINTR